MKEDKITFRTIRRLLLFFSPSDSRSALLDSSTTSTPDCPDERDGNADSSRVPLLSSEQRLSQDADTAPRLGLISSMREWIRMDSPTADKIGANVRTSETLTASSSKDAAHQGATEAAVAGGTRANQPSSTEYRVYKRRFFGLFQLVLLNIIVSWDWLTFAASSDTVATYFRTSESNVNWLSTGFLFAFVVISPVTLWTLHLGPKPAIITSSVLILVGNWIRYGGTRANNFPTVVFGQVIIGFAQPFVLAAPTRYSDLWFTDRGRISATAVASLANPFGGALGQLIGPFWAENPSDVPNLVLYVSILSSVAAIPSFFIPARPPTPPSASSAIEKPQIVESIRSLARNRPFWIVFSAFSTYVAAFNALSSLLNQIMAPYGFSEDEAGIGGAILIVVGLVTAAVTSPIIDRTKKYLLMIKLCVPVIGICYLVFIWMPQTMFIAPPYVILAILGAASFGLVPVALEYLVEVTWPASPEVTSVVSWTGGQLLGGIWIVIMDRLKDRNASDGPKDNMNNALIFLAVGSMLAIVPPMLLGYKKFGTAGSDTGRLAVDQRRAAAQGGNIA